MLITLDTLPTVLDRLAVTRSEYSIGEDVDNAWCLTAGPSPSAFIRRISCLLWTTGYGKRHQAERPGTRHARRWTAR